MKKLLNFWVEKGIPISKVDRTIQIWRSKELKQKWAAMESGDSIVLPYSRDTVVGIVSYGLICRQINDRQYRYWKT
jgi:hypothetical protein